MNQEKTITKLRKLRIDRGLSLRRVERETGYSYSQIYKSEVGLSNRKRMYDSRTETFYDVMAQYYGVSVEDIKP